MLWGKCLQKMPHSASSKQTSSAGSYHHLCSTAGCGADKSYICWMCSATPQPYRNSNLKVTLFSLHYQIVEMHKWDKLWDDLQNLSEGGIRGCRTVSSYESNTGATAADSKGMIARMQGSLAGVWGAERVKGGIREHFRLQTGELEGGTAGGSCFNVFPHFPLSKICARIVQTMMQVVDKGV